VVGKAPGTKKYEEEEKKKKKKKKKHRVRKVISKQ